MLFRSANAQAQKTRAEATSGNGAGSGSMLIAWGSRAVVALKRMETNGVLWNFSENKRPEK